jgi:ferredoxin--NADP+ reductase
MARTDQNYVAVIGAGPAGLFGAFELASQGAEVVIFNRDIKPGGLAEYGIYPTKYRLRQGLRAQFHTILSMQGIDYFGNVTIGDHADIPLGELQGLGFHAVLVTAGAQGIKWLKIPGERGEGFYHAKDIVYHYNNLPPFSTHSFQIGKRVAIIGMGNVMVDIARWLITERGVSEVIAFGRRGPNEIKFDKKEFSEIVPFLDIEDYHHQVDMHSPLMVSLGEDPSEAREMPEGALKLSETSAIKAKFSILFLHSPREVLRNEDGNVVGLTIEENTLVRDGGEVRARGTGKQKKIEVDTVILAIGDKVDENLGLPINGIEYRKNPDPLYPVDGQSFEMIDPGNEKNLEGVFLAGWSRTVSKGQVGIAHKDGVNAARSVLQFLDSRKDWPQWSYAGLNARLAELGKFAVRPYDLVKLERAEAREAESRGLPEYKYATNEEMLRVMGYAF